MTLFQEDFEKLPRKYWKNVAQTWDKFVWQFRKNFDIAWTICGEILKIYEDFYKNCEETQTVYVRRVNFEIIRNLVPKICSFKSSVLIGQFSLKCFSFFGRPFWLVNNFSKNENFRITSTADTKMWGCETK